MTYGFVTRELTQEEAAMIRRWRIDDSLSWRGVAWHWDEYVNRRPEGNQLQGMDLCEAAAAHYGENYMEPPWN